METLLLNERKTAGFWVVLSYDPSSKVVWLTGETELHGSMVTVAPENASNAFLHPCCYLESPALFFKAEPQGEGETEEEHTSEKGYDNLSDALDDLDDFKQYGGETAADHIDEEDGA